MRYEDASQGGQPADNSHTVARPDVDTLPPGSYGPAGGNTISGSGTTSGASGADIVGAPPAKIVEVQGAGGATTVASGNFQATGQFGVLTMDAAGNFNYVRNPNTPDGVKDVFNYTLADASGANSSTTLTIDIGQVAAAAAGQGIVSLPAGVELSDIHVNGRDLIVDMPDGTQMVIPGGAVFVPQLMIGDVQVPPSNLAALLIDSEPQPAAGPPTSSGADWNDPVPPLDPGVPLGDLIPPTELVFTPPEFKEPGFFEAQKPTVIIETPDNPAGVVDASESVNEKGLPGRDDGKPAGSGEIADGNPFNNSDPSETNTGTIVFTAPDGFQSITVDGVAITTVGQTIQGQFGTMTITSIDIATGQIGYSYTLADNTSGDNTQDLFSVVVTDKGGNTATASLTVHIIDDVPTARNDTDSTDLVTHVATGNVITGADTTSGSAGADTVGADNAQVTAISGAGGSNSTFDSNGNLVVHGQFGVLTIHADGSYSYTENQGAPGGSVDTFTYTLTDGDGDTSTATLTINNPDHVPVVGPNALVQLDDDALPGGNPGGVGDGPDAVNTTGTLSGSGGDGQLTWDLQTSGAPSGFTYVNGPNGSVLVQQVQDGHTVTVLTITVNATTGAYTVTQNAPIDHAPGGNENNADFTINYTVTDADGDTANGTLNIQVNDDTPVVTLADTTVPTLTVDETNLSVNATASFASDFTVSFGADGPATTNSLTYTLGISASGADSGLIDTASGNHVFLFLENGEVVGREGTNATTAASGPEVFTVSIDSSGNVTLDQIRAVVQPDGTNPDTSEGVTLSSAGLVTVTGTITDKDGDSSSATANIGQNLNFLDDGPTISLSGQAEPTLSVDETNLSINATASIAGLFTSSFGADGAGSITYALHISASGTDSGLIDTASGNHVFLFLENGEVVGREGASAAAAQGTGPIVFTVSIDSSGDVTLDQQRAVVHPDATNPDTNETVTLSADNLVSVTATITDKDGDSATQSVNLGQNLIFHDDGPTAIVPASITTTDEVQSVITASLDTDNNVANNFGADGPGSITFANITNGEDSGFTSGGTEITLWLSDNGQTLEGRINSTDGTDGTLIYTVHIDQANSQYDYTQSGLIDNGSGVSFDNLTSTKAGITNIYGIGADATGSPDVDAMLSATSGGASSTINTNVDSIGIGNQAFNAGDSLRIDFVTALTTDAGNATIGFDYGQHVETNLFSEDVVKVLGNTNASFQVWALQTGDTDGNFPDSNPSGNFTDSTKEPITTVGIEGTNSTTQPMVTTTLTTVGQVVTIAYGVTATLQSDGSVIFGNVPEGFTYEIGTGANSFNAVDVQDVSGSFKLGVFALGTTNFGNPVTLNYDLQITDGDGDSASVPGGVSITLNPTSTSSSSAVINNSSIHTQDVAHTALNTSSLMASNDNLEQQGQRVFGVGQNAALMGALAAAGLDAEHLTLDGHHLALSIGDRSIMMPLQAANLGSVTALSAGAEQPVHSVAAMPAVHSTPTVQQSAPMHDMVASAHPLGGPVSAQPVTMNALLHGSTFIDGHAIAANVHSITAPAVVMPSAHQLAAAAHGSPRPANSVAGSQHDAVVGKVLADALHGGATPGQSVDALLHSLPVHAAGANGALQALATHAGPFVSIEHMAMAGPFGSPHTLLTVEMVMHQDAPPPAHG